MFSALAARGILLIWLALLTALGTAACQRFAREPTILPTSTPTVVSAAVGNRIAYVGDDFGIYTISPDGSDRRRLTQEEGLYTWPAWSPDGSKLLFSSFSLDPFGPGKALYSSEPSGAGLKLLFENLPGTGPAVGPRVPHYTIWSPNGQYVALLAAGELGLTLYLVPESGQGEPQPIAAGAPLYLAWSKDSESLLVHQQTGLLRVDLGARENPFDLKAESFAYRTPAWAPTSDVIAFIASEKGGETLYVGRFDGSSRRALERIEGIASFLWAPQGDRLAVGQSFDSNEQLMEDIRVINVETGEARSLVEREVIAFFWSPDGSKIAYVTFNDGRTALQWRVIEVEAAQDRALADFRPSSDQLIMFAFFDQYAYSHRVWSPDSRRLVFAGAIAEADQLSAAQGSASQIIVLDAAGNTPPQTIAAGPMATWSMR